MKELKGIDNRKKDPDVTIILLHKSVVIDLTRIAFTNQIIRVRTNGNFEGRVDIESTSKDKKFIIHCRKFVGIGVKRDNTFIQKNDSSPKVLLGRGFKTLIPLQNWIRSFSQRSENTESANLCSVLHIFEKKRQPWDSNPRGQVQGISNPSP